MFESFSPENRAHLLERGASLEQLEKMGNVWIGPDVKVEKSEVAKPGYSKEIGVVINKKDLPSSFDITRGAMSSLSLSVRSFYAQVGIDIRFHGGSLTNEMLESLNAGEDTVVPVDVINNGQRDVKLEGEIMRFFWVNDRNRLRGQELVDSIKSGEFVVDGVEGEDWFLGGYNPDDKLTTTSENSDQALCVVVRLKPEKLYVPYDSKPVVKDDAKKTRDDLENLLKPIPDGEKVNFEIGETPRIKMGSDIVGVINTGTNNGERHINSPLIDSGSDWPIRTETLNGLQYIDFFLYRE